MTEHPWEIGQSVRSDVADKGALLGADGRWLRIDDNGSPTSPNFRIRRTVSAGTYYIRVYGSNSSVSGRYTLVVRFRAS